MTLNYCTSELQDFCHQPFFSDTTGPVNFCLYHRTQLRFADKKMTTAYSSIFQWLFKTLRNIFTCNIMRFLSIYTPVCLYFIFPVIWYG